MIALPLGGEVRFLAVASPAYFSLHQPPEGFESVSDIGNVRAEMEKRSYTAESNRRAGPTSLR
jgi:hypothetical protein